MPARTAPAIPQRAIPLTEGCRAPLNPLVRSTIAAEIIESAARIQRARFIHLGRSNWFQPPSYQTLLKSCDGTKWRKRPVFVHETGTMRGGSQALRYARVARDARNWPYMTLLRTNHHSEAARAPATARALSASKRRRRKAGTAVKVSRSPAKGRLFNFVSAASPRVTPKANMSQRRRGSSLSWRAFSDRRNMNNARAQRVMTRVSLVTTESTTSCFGRSATSRPTERAVSARAKTRRAQL